MLSGCRGFAAQCPPLVLQLRLTAIRDSTIFNKLLGLPSEALGTLFHVRHHL